MGIGFFCWSLMEYWDYRTVDFILWSDIGLVIPLTFSHNFYCRSYVVLFFYYLMRWIWFLKNNGYLTICGTITISFICPLYFTLVYLPTFFSLYIILYKYLKNTVMHRAQMHHLVVILKFKQHTRISLKEVCMSGNKIKFVNNCFYVLSWIHIQRTEAWYKNCSENFLLIKKMFRKFSIILCN